MVTPYIINLKLDPFERFLESRGFDEWQENRSFALPLAMGVVNQFMTSLQDYPPRSASVNFNVDEALKALTPKSGH